MKKIELAKLIILMLVSSCLLFSEVTVSADFKELVKSPAEIIYLTTNVSKILKLDFAAQHVAVGNSEIADVLLNSDKELLINAKLPGITSVTVWNALRTLELKIAVGKVSQGYYFENYKLNNIQLVANNLEDAGNSNVVTREPYKETITDITNVLSGYFESNRYAVDPWTNSVFVVGNDEEHLAVAELLAKLDSLQKQVVFQVEIYELKQENSLKDELQLLYQKNQGNTEFNKTEGLQYTWTSTAEFAEMASHILVYLRKEGKAKLIANPNILTIDGKYSRIFAGEKVPYLKYDAQGNPIVEYISTGVMLGVIPNINDKGLINCWTLTQASSISGYSAENGYPNISERTAVNEVRLTDGGMFILGGLLKDVANENYQKVPLLGDLLGWIPLIGPFFKSREESKVNTELVISIRPKIIFNDQDLMGTGAAK